MASTNVSHRWRFFRAGGVDQVQFRDGKDIANIGSLDQKLWMALAVPTRGTELDPITADLVDTDSDGRIRPPEIIAAVQWATGVLKDVGYLMKGGDSVPLSEIADASTLASAKRILTTLKKPAATAISLADVADTAQIFAETKFNGDGVIIAEATDDDAVRKAIDDVITALGPVADRSGKPGINQASVDQFFTEAQTLVDWVSEGEADKTLTPLGLAGTAAASAAVKATKGKIDDFFARCRLAAFDARALASMNRDEKDFAALAAQELTISSAAVAALPLAKVEANRALPLAEGINPAWTMALATCASAAIAPLLGARTTLSEADWDVLQSKIAAFDAWSASKPATTAEGLGLPRLRELLVSSGRAEITELIKQDTALEGEFNQIASVERLVRFQKDLFELLTNSVNFADFYGRTGAVFQAGILYLDARSCQLCLEVTDAGRHAALAGLAGAYLAYCEISRAGGYKKTICAVFTNGDRDNLMVGRNGVFYDRAGKDWDATITKVVDNPISIREAFWSPYKKLIRLIDEQIAKRAATADSAANAHLAQTATTATTLNVATPAQPKKIDVGTVAALGVAFGSIGTALSFLATKFFDLSAWQIPLLILGVVLVISVPAMVIAYLKLRKRNLGPILDANGWAINTVARMNVPFGASLTDLRRIPPGAERSLKDPYAEKRSPWPRIIIFLIVLAIAYAALNRFGLIHEWTGGRLGSAPAVVATAPAAAVTPAAPQPAATQ
ncbi:MAG: hypothetical protein ABI640_14860 [Gammaproteobacteria bacterium]